MKKIGIFGFGNMGQAIFQILKQLPSNTNELFISSLNVEKIPGATCLSNLEDLLDHCDVVFICVKPQDFYNIKIDKNNLKENRVILISIMAGITISNIKKIIPFARIARCMPNIALQIQEGVIGWYAPKKEFLKNEITSISQLLNLFGEAIFLEKENMLNSITAISGSGPAYVFLFADSLIEAAESLGFSSNDAKKIVFKTITGSITYAKMQKDSTLKELICKVTSKNGTTEAALKELDTKLFYKNWLNATKKACQRAEELSSK